MESTSKINDMKQFCCKECGTIVSTANDGYIDICPIIFLNDPDVECGGEMIDITTIIDQSIDFDTQEFQN